MSAEAASVDSADIENWVSLLPGILNSYEPCNVYNAGELGLGLFFRVQPSKMFCLKGDDCHGGKVSKDRMTVLLCCTEDGSYMLKS